MKAKKLLSAIIAGTMALATVSFSAFAENEVAQIDETKYETLAAAVEAAQSGETVTLLCNASGSGVAIMKDEAKDITIDLGGYTYTVSGGAVGSTNYETQGFHLEEGSNITIKKGTITSTADSGVFLLVQNYCNLTLEDVTLDGTKLPTPSGWPCGYVMSNNCGNTVLKGNTNIITKDGDVAFDSCKFGNYTIPTVTVETTGTISGKIEMTGGNLFVKSGTFTVDLSEYCADGYKATQNNDGTYTVSAVSPAVAQIGETKYETLAAAVEAAQSGETVKLLNDITLTETYTITNTNAITIDFNGCYIDVTGINIDFDSIVLNSNTNVTFVGNGGIKGNKNCLTNYGGSVTLNGGTYTSTLIGRGSTVYNASGTLKINSGVKIDAYKFAVYNCSGAVCVMNGGEIVSHAHNGLQPDPATGSNLVGYAYAVVNSGTMTINDETVIKGIQGALSATGDGTTNVYGGNIVTYENSDSENRSFYACYAANNANLTIFGGTFTAAKRSALFIGNEDANLDNAKVKIEGGTFVSNGSADSAAIQTNVVGDLIITGGTFSSNVKDYVADGYASITNNDGTYSVKAIAAAGVAPAEITVSNELLTNNGYTVQENTYARGEQITMPSVSGNTLNATYVFTKTADSTTKDYTFAFDISKLDIASANLGILIYNIPEAYTVADPIITID